MTFVFPSPEWVAAYSKAINDSGAYRAASAAWTHGPVALVVNGRPDIGLPDSVGIWLELDRGVCRAARLITPIEAEQAPFVITGDYTRWKEVVQRQLAPVAGILQRKLALRGSLAIVVRFIQATEELVNAAAAVPTRFLDE